MEKPDFGMTTARLASLSDNVFSVAMTLLVFNLTIPAAQKFSELELHVILRGQWHKFLNYFISFLLLAILWEVHHRQFQYIRRTDRTHLWLNILILMFVALMPFSTSLIGDFGGSRTAGAFFSANMVVLAVLFHVNWVYAMKGSRLVHPGLSEESLRGRRRSVVFLLASLLAFVLSFFIAEWCSLSFLLIPIVNTLPGFRTAGRADPAPAKQD
jgi:uncharacterized membrane protein